MVEINGGCSCLIVYLAVHVNVRQSGGGGKRRASSGREHHVRDGSQVVKGVRVDQLDSA